MKRTHVLLTTSLFLGILLALVLGVHGASAHEVYVLSSAEIHAAEAAPTISPITVIKENLSQFSFWALIVIVSIFVIFFISTIRILEKRLDPFFAKARHWAPVICRVTVGLSFLAGAYYQASYGPELPIVATYGAYTPIVTGVLILLGLSLIFDIWTRVAAVIALLMYAIAVYYHGWYMLTYVNYLGEFIALLLVTTPLKKYSFLVIRVLFGSALIYTSVYAKLWYSNLALDTVNKLVQGHPLTYYLPFEAHFLVLGAALIEILIGTFFILGIEIRFTALFINFWLALSLIHFGEVVWPHIILIGIPIAFFFYGYDKYSLEGYFFKKGKREPVL